MIPSLFNVSVRNYEMMVRDELMMRDEMMMRDELMMRDDDWLR